MALRRWRPLQALFANKSFSSAAFPINVVASNALGINAESPYGDKGLNVNVLNPTEYGGIGVVFLGSSAGGTLSSFRGVSSLLVMIPGRCWMFDCGEGTQRQLHRCCAPGVRPKRIERIFITHMHGDHVLGLPGLLCTLCNSSSRTEPFYIYGPVGIKAFVLDCLRYTYSKINLNLVFHELSQDQIPKGSDTIQLIDHPDYEVVAAPIKHTVPCWGYVIREKDIRGTVDAVRLEADGLPPGPLYRRIKQGEDVVDADGRVFKARNYVSEDIRGRKITILGDTCNPSRIAAAAEGSDLLIHEATSSNKEAAMAVSRGHSSAGMAGSFARSISAGYLALNHISPKVSNYGVFLHEPNIDLVAEARASFHSNRVIAAFDFLSLTLERPIEKVSAAPS